MELPLATWTPGRPRVQGHAALLQSADRPEGDGLDTSHSRRHREPQCGETGENTVCRMSGRLGRQSPRRCRLFTLSRYIEKLVPIYKSAKKIWSFSTTTTRVGGKESSVMILPQVHLRKPCYDFYFL